MRHEIIRMEHVNISRPGRHEIEDLNLIICRGYSMGVAGVENSKEILADFFEGKGTLARGRIYLDGQPWKPEGKRDFEDAGIFCDLQRHGVHGFARCQRESFFVTKKQPA